MAFLGKSPFAGACVGTLLLAAGVQAQNQFVLPWIDPPPKSKPTAVIQAVSTGQEPAQPAPQKPAPVNPLLVEAQPRTPEQEMGLLLQLTPPAPERLFQFQSEAKLRLRIRDELKGFKVEFPPTSEGQPAFPPAPRMWPYLMATAEPNYVCYKRLWFEQKNTERYGWDFQILQPVIDVGVFYTDLALLPLHWLTDPCRCFDCSAGRCLPGDPLPLLWNPVMAK